MHYQWWPWRWWQCCVIVFLSCSLSFLLSIDEAHGHCLVCIWESLKIKKEKKDAQLKTNKKKNRSKQNGRRLTMTTAATGTPWLLIKTTEKFSQQNSVVIVRVMFDQTDINSQNKTAGRQNCRAHFPSFWPNRMVPQHFQMPTCLFTSVALRCPHFLLSLLPSITSISISLLTKPICIFCWYIPRAPSTNAEHLLLLQWSSNSSCST